MLVCVLVPIKCFAFIFPEFFEKLEAIRCEVIGCESSRVILLLLFHFFISKVIFLKTFFPSILHLSAVSSLEGAMAKARGAPPLPGSVCVSPARKTQSNTNIFNDHWSQDECIKRCFCRAWTEANTYVVVTTADVRLLDWQCEFQSLWQWEQYLLQTLRCWWIPTCFVSTRWSAFKHACMCITNQHLFIFVK